ncbi:cyclophilin-like fold protein [Treponema sp. UBA6852]|uniref:cyclophilin-like fold protein n=1 Tax=Treponema sp. UBA6852 TaxID=1947744 RepID=UPI0025F65C83|nr:cyclophilin-like fold protein [Treponema sp. UBA6852]
MKKLILAFALLCVLCGSVFAERVKIIGGGQTFNAQIERTELSAQMLDRMPLELDMTKLYSFLIYGDRAIDVSGVKGFRGGLKKGDITYCTYGYLIILTDDQPAGQSSRFVKVGQIDSGDISKLNAISHGGKIRIERAE